MKYTKKQLEKAYEQWITEVRLNPSVFISEKEMKKKDIDEDARLNVETLISYIK